MPFATRQVPAYSDALGEALHLLQVTGTLYCRAELTAPWAVDVPPLDDVITFQIVTAGRCWLELPGAEPLLLEPGSMTLIPHGGPHRLRSSGRPKAKPLFELAVERLSERYELMRYGGGGEPTQIMYGVLRVDQLVAERLVALLPRVLYVNGWNAEVDGWLASTLRLIAHEASTLDVGGEAVITRLADVLVIQAIRGWLKSSASQDQGWLTALRDPQIGRALAAIHRSPAENLTLTRLAKTAGLSRSAFSARFTRLVGRPAMSYLADYRVRQAEAHLVRTAEPLAVVAGRFGYKSEAAFSRAFSRVLGKPPGHVRKAT